MRTIKSLVYSILCNSVSGALIRRLFQRVPDLRWPGFSFVVPAKSVNGAITASIFWGFYESSEIRLVQKKIGGEFDVVELGSSLGVVASHLISRLRPGKQLISVEANPLLIDTIKENVRNHTRTSAQFIIINKAIGYEGDFVNLDITDNNTESRINESQTSNSISVATCSLSEILIDNNIERFTLVCDIEGSEAGILMNDGEAFRNCCNILIELHETEYKGVRYSEKDLLAILVTQYGFVERESHGPVYYLEKTIKD